MYSEFSIDDYRIRIYENGDVTLCGGIGSERKEYRLDKKHFEKRLSTFLKNYIKITYSVEELK
jgi:hypothetical protein